MTIFILFLILLLIGNFFLWKYVSNFHDKEIEENLPTIVLSGGIIISFLVFTVFCFFANIYFRAGKVAINTIKEKNEEDLINFKLAVEGTSEHIVITDPKGIILFANKAVEDITGYKQKEIIGKKSSLWGGHMEKKFYKKFWETIKIKKQAFKGEINNIRKNGEHYTAKINVSPILDNQGEVKFFLGIERDITKEKEIDRAKTEFVSLASHQLRTPLSTIKWFSDMLFDGDAGELNKEQKEYISQIQESNKRMIDLVNSLLNVSRIELGRIIIEPEPTNLHELVKRILIELKQQINQKKIKILTNIEKNIPKINIDPKLITEVYSNLIANAVKYTPNKGQISITISSKGDQLISQITDTGYGIQKNEQSKVFKKFFRGTNIKKIDTDGNGLGMYLIKEIIETSGGKIWFESKENKGSTFWFSLPKKGSISKKGKVALNR